MICMSKSEGEDSEACYGVLFEDNGIEKKTMQILRWQN